MATNFLEAAGTNGFIASPFNIMGTTDLASLGNGSTVTSTHAALTQSDFASAIWCQVAFQAAGAFTPTAGGYIGGWWLNSDNGGTNYEKVVSNTGLPRAPDFVIPLFASAYASGDRSWAQGLIKCPFGTCKAYILNASGVSLSANNHQILAAPVAIQY
jgi:hypothetical protein